MSQTTPNGKLKMSPTELRKGVNDQPIAQPRVYITIIRKGTAVCCIRVPTWYSPVLLFEKPGPRDKKSGLLALHRHTICILVTVDDKDLLRAAFVITIPWFRDQYVAPTAAQQQQWSISCEAEQKR